MKSWASVLRKRRAGERARAASLFDAAPGARLSAPRLPSFQGRRCRGFPWLGFDVFFGGMSKARVRRGIAGTKERIVAGLDLATRREDQAMPRRRPTRSFPGRLTLEQWLERPLPARIDLIWRAQCDLLGSFRFCANKRCRRARTCRGADPEACSHGLWCRKAKKPKTLRQEWSRLVRLKSL